MRITIISGGSPKRMSDSERPTSLTRISLRAALVLSLSLTACGAPEPQSPAATDKLAPAIATVNASATPVLDARSALALANTAFREDRFVTPAGNNALEYTLHALDQEPSNSGAMEILVDLTPIAAAAIEADISSGNFSEAERVMALLTRANPGSLTVQGLERRLAIATRPVPTPVVAEVARAELTESAAAPPTAIASREVVATSTPDASDASELAAATSSQSEQDASDRLAAVVAAQPRAVTEPQPTGTRSAEPVAVLKITPDYPAAAKKRRTEGWVELQFLVGADGVPRDIEVVRAQPSGMFDRSAIRAMSRWKFKPAERDGKPIEARAKTTVGFKLG